MAVAVLMCLAGSLAAVTYVYGEDADGSYGTAGAGGISFIESEITVINGYTRSLPVNIGSYAKEDIGYRMDNSDIASPEAFSVDNGVSRDEFIIKGLAAGTTVLTMYVKADESVNDTCTIHVENYVGTPCGTYFFFIKFAEGSTAGAVGLTDTEAKAGFWTVGYGDNAMAALQDTCDANGWQLSYDGTYYEGWLDKFMNLPTILRTNGEWTYWAQYHWNGEAWQYNDYTLGYLSTTDYQYIAMVYCTTSSSYSGTADLGSDPSGIPEELLTEVSAKLTFTAGVPFSIPAGAVNVPISDINVSGGVSGGVPPYAFTATGLPSGITINGTTGIISGTPTATAPAGTATVTVTDSAGDSKSITISYGIISAVPAPLTFADSDAYDIPASSVGTPISDINVSGGVSGGVPPYAFTAAGLPAGISVTSAGVITGTPAAAASAGTATVTVTDSAGDSKSITISYSVISEAPVPLTFAHNSVPFSIPSASMGIAIAPVNVSGGVSGGVPPYSFTAAGLPSGIAINGTTGIISGIPDVKTGAGTATITVTDSAGASKSITVAYGAVLPQVIYEVTGVSADSWTKGGTEGFTIKCNADREDLVGVRVDGVLVSASGYTVTDGSTILTLSPAYLETLSVGEHTVDMLFDGFGVASATLTVAAGDPGGSSGGGSGMMFIAAAAIVCAAAAAVVYLAVIRKH